MKLIVENLGAVQYAEIDLNKQFYVFVGKNNSGKTYLSHLMWLINGGSGLNFSYKFVSMIDKKDYFDEQKGYFCSKELIVKITELYSQFLIANLPESMNVPVNHFIFENLKISFVYDVEEELMKIYKKFVSFGYLLIPNSDFPNYFTFNKNNTDIFSRLTYRDADFTGFVASLLFNTTNYDCFLPTQRIFIPNFYKHIYEKEREYGIEMNKSLNLFIKNTQETDREKLKKLLYQTPYSKVSEVLFEKLFDKDNTNFIEIPNNPYQDLLIKLQAIMDGNIVLSKSEGIAPAKFAFQSENKADLELYLASSSVNQLTLLYLYLKYWLKEMFNFLIIDEPEMHLHPSNQLALLNLLIEFSQRNNRVLITTHSTLLADAINNHLLLASLENRDEMAKKYNMTYLDPKTTGVYYFSGDSVSEYKIGDYGTIFKDFREAQNYVADANQEFTDLFFEQKNRR